jgi:hypothetical protein
VVLVGLFLGIVLPFVLAAMSMGPWWRAASQGKPGGLKGTCIAVNDQFVTLLKGIFGI